MDCSDADSGDAAVKGLFASVAVAFLGARLIDWLVERFDEEPVVRPDAEVEASPFEMRLDDVENGATVWIRGTLLGSQFVDDHSLRVDFGTPSEKWICWIRRDAEVRV